jgi:hypothetical protein
MKEVQTSTQPLVCTATELFHARPAEGKSIVARTTIPHHYQTHDLLPRKVRVHEDGVTYQALEQSFGTFGASPREVVQLVPWEVVHT